MVEILKENVEKIECQEPILEQSTNDEASMMMKLKQHSHFGIYEDLKNYAGFKQNY